MGTVNILPADSLGRNFIPPEYLPEGKDEYYLRRIQNGGPETNWRNLSSEEIERLAKNNNTARDWADIYVSGKFDTDQIKNNDFFGMVRIGTVRDITLKHRDLQVPAGITNSVITSCDIGPDCAVHNVRNLSHYIIGPRCLLTNIDEMQTADCAKFGNGIIKEGESEDTRISLDLMNESGGRSVLPFNGIIAADAYIWARYRDDKVLMKKLKDITQSSFDPRRGFYGTIGEQCVIKNSGAIKDVKIGPHCYIKGSNKLKNLTINSSEQEPTHIGEGVELVNGIIGYGCHIFYGCKAVRFVLGNNSNLKYGARLIHSFLGDNSTISCCEVLNNLIFPAHEQHHNNSFLIASLVMGQSNIAAGATIGSNHNGRANDNEIRAGRGFWPGLCSSLKHPSRFASFTLISKGSFPYELNIPLPFSLVNNNTGLDRLEIIPAFWWMYNMYALARNSWKFKARDKRVTRAQNIEFETLAPDTVEEIFAAMELLEIWTGRAILISDGQSAFGIDDAAAAERGREALNGAKENVDRLEIRARQIEKSSRGQVILKVYEAYRAYKQMAGYYAVKTLAEYLSENPGRRIAEFSKSKERQRNWVNLGGQLVAETDADKIREDIGNGRLAGWAEIHERYNKLWEEYPAAKREHAYACLCELCRTDSISADDWLGALDKAAEIQEIIADRVYSSRKKDFDNPFRKAVYSSAEEMKATVGCAEEDEFVIRTRRETADFRKIVKELKQRAE